MKMRKGYPLLFATMALSLLLLSACASGSTGAAPSTLTPQQVIQKSVEAMKNLNSDHMELKTTAQVNTNGQSTGALSNINITANGQGDQSYTNQQQQFTLNYNALGQTSTLSEITSGDKLYVKNSQGKWYVISKDAMKNSGVSADPFSNLTIDQNTLLGALQNFQIKDNGADTLNGQSLRHITAILDQQAFKQLVAQSPQLKGTLGTNLDTLLNNVKSFNSTIDTWISEQDFYLRRTELKLDMTTDLSSLAKNGTTGSNGTAANNVNTKLDFTVDLSKFNQPVTINMPANATPTANPRDIFGMSQQTS